MLETSLEVMSSTNPLAEVKITSDIIKTDDFNKKYEYLAELVKYLNDVKKDVDTKIKELVKEHYVETGENSVGSESYRYTYVPMTTRESLDTKLLKKEAPDIYKQYVKITNVADSLRTYKLKKDEETETD